MEVVKRHPLNAEGDFFVECDCCLSCDAPRSEAPELIDYDEEGHCYFKRQPQTSEEIDHAVNAVWVSCVEAVRYAGDNPEILAKIQHRYGMSMKNINSNIESASITKSLFKVCSRIWMKVRNGK